MLRKHSILISVIASAVLLFVATTFYPGGSQHDAQSVGYDWQNNYLSNLFAKKAINGMYNSSRPWAIGGMFFLSLGFALFFIQFSKRISSKTAAKIIRYAGVASMIFAFLAVTPYHDEVVTKASSLALVSMFCITVFVFKTRLHFFKVFCVASLLLTYSCNYVYHTKNYIAYLPIMQKFDLLLAVIWILSLQYFTEREDFEV
jgi:hypothetical protein